MNTTTRQAGDQRVDFGWHTLKDRGRHNPRPFKACYSDTLVVAALSTLLVVAVSLAGSPRTAAGQAAEQPVGPAKGPLRAHPKNPRYFADGSGKAIYLTGSHTWNTLQDWGREDLGAVRVQLKTDKRNLQSQIAIERLGAIRERVLRKHMLVRGGFIRDTVLYSITDDEWPMVKARLEAKMAAYDSKAPE